ncbi:MAG: hypothetical protein H6819_12810 [Phycisphaerales bacterium]|nr:hypothetical protein [Phycisphaerales bacterium]MCB9858761.1 hypothetical protein [Phycisphaerales bacterium]
MRSTVRCLVMALCAVVAPTSLVAGPGDLLDQAIEENEGQRQLEVNAGEVADIVARADRLMDQKSFTEAVRLYESAYRLAPDNRANFARMLVARRAAGLMTDSDREALSIIEEEQRANVASTFRGVRLDIIQTREALGSADFQLAERLIAGAEFDLRGLPRDIDATPYWRQLTQLRKSLARKRGYEPNEPRGADLARAEESRGRIDDTGVLLLGDTGEETAATTSPPVDASVVASHSDTGDIVDVDDLLAATQRRLEYDRDLDRAIAAARADMLLTAAEAALPPSAQGDMTFPQNWAEKSAKRSKYRDGVIYRTPDFTGPDGQTYYTAIYDLGDLVHPVPNFYAPWALSGWEQRVQMEDRAALRNRSQIFGGYADDLAAGLPLLHFFGGVDNNAVSTRTDPRESQRVVRMIEQFMR